MTIGLSTLAIAKEIIDGRERAHEKHGDESIEAVPALDAKRWLPILIEEVGELSHELTYDAHPRVDVFDGQALSAWQNEGATLRGMRSELLDVATVAVAWIAAIDRDLAERLA